MTLKDIEEMTRERIGTKEIAALYGMSPGDVLRKAHSDDPEQRWPFNFTWNGNRLMVPREAFLAWARGVRGNENGQDRKSTRLNSSHSGQSRMPSSA